MELLLADGQTSKQFDENEPDVLDGGKFYPFARGVPHLLWFVLRIEGGIPMAVVEDSHIKVWQCQNFLIKNAIFP